jgi:DNA-binding CsgD family transcriptional regulator
MPGADGFSDVTAFAPDLSAPLASQHNVVPTPPHRTPETGHARPQDRYALERLRLLCQLRLNPAVLLPELLANLRSVMPALAATVTWNSAAHGTCVATESADHFALAKHAQHHPLLWQSLHAQGSTCSVLASADASVRAALLAHAPQFLCHIADHHALTVSLCAAQQVIGCIALYHATPGVQFSTHEQAVLVNLAPALATALHAEHAPTDTLFVPASTGTMLLDDDGHLLHVCARAQRLMCLANLDVPDSTRALGAMCRQYSAAPATQQSNAAVATREHVNAAGHFVLHMQRLKPLVAGLRLGGTLVNITHCVPLALNVLRQCAQLALPPKQTRIAVHLVQGDAYDAIAAQLDISAHTVIDHARKLQQRLGARNRSELVARLVAG